jgi:hypothetical protein
VQPIRGDRSWWPFSRGSRACLRDGDCAAEMFSSLLFYYLFVTFSTIWGAKVLISFELRKKYVRFFTFHFSLFTFFRTFAPEIDIKVTFLGI